MRQEITRNHKGWALDAVVLSNDVTKFMKEELNNPPNEGIVVSMRFCLDKWFQGFMFMGYTWMGQVGRSVMRD